MQSDDASNVITQFTRTVTIKRTSENNLQYACNKNWRFPAKPKKLHSHLQIGNKSLRSELVVLSIKRESAADLNSINEKEIITMNPIGDVPTLQPSNTYLTLRVDQCNSDDVYEETSTFGITRAEYEMGQMTSDEIYDDDLTIDQCSSDDVYEETSMFGITRAEYEMGQMTSDEIYDDILTKRKKSGEYKLDLVTNVYTQQESNANPTIELNQRYNDERISEEEAVCDDMNAAKKQMILVMVTVNVILLLFTVLAIVGGILIKSKFEQVRRSQNWSMNQVNELTTSMNANISHISMQLQNIQS